MLKTRLKSIIRINFRRALELYTETLLSIDYSVFIRKYFLQKQRLWLATTLFTQSVNKYKEKKTPMAMGTTMYTIRYTFIMAAVIK